MTFSNFLRFLQLFVAFTYSTIIGFFKMSTRLFLLVTSPHFFACSRLYKLKKSKQPNYRWWSSRNWNSSNIARLESSIQTPCSVRTSCCLWFICKWGSSPSSQTMLIFCIGEWIHLRCCTTETRVSKHLSFSPNLGSTKYIVFREGNRIFELPSWSSGLYRRNIIKTTDSFPTWSTCRL